MKTSNLRTVALSEIINLPTNHVANIWPILDNTVDELKKHTLTIPELADSIKENGLQEPIILFDDSEKKETVILDGRNRRLACELVAKDSKTPLDEFMVTVENFIGTKLEATRFVFVRNHRRDTTASQKAISAAKFELECPEEFALMVEAARSAQTKAAETTNAKRRGDALAIDGQSVETDRAWVNEQLAQMFFVSVGYVKDARRELRQKQADLEAVERYTKEAERLAEEAAKAVALAEEAKAKEDADKLREATSAKNRADNQANAARERAVEHATSASKRESKIESVHKGNKSLRDQKPSPGQKIKSDKDPIELGLEHINDGHRLMLNGINEIASGYNGEGKDNAIENVAVKFYRVEDELKAKGWI